jgi:hypothetical protein
MKINELTTHEKSCKKHKCILLSERSQFEWGTSCMIPMYCILEKAKLRDRRVVVARVSRERGGMNRWRIYLCHFKDVVIILYDTVMVDT